MDIGYIFFAIVAAISDFVSACNDALDVILKFGTVALIFKATDKRDKTKH